MGVCTVFSHLKRKGFRQKTGFLNTLTEVHLLRHPFFLPINRLIMKKILLATNILLLGIIVINSCTNGTHSTNTAGVDPTTSGRPPVTSRDRIAYEVERYVGDEGLTDYNLARKMSMDYKADAFKGKVWGSDGANDATSIWFSLDRLRDFMAAVDSSVSQGSCKPRLGIRIYFIKYPSDMSAYASLQELNGPVGNHHSIMMVPTFMDTIEFGTPGAPKNVDFNFKDIGNDSCRPQPYFKSTSGSFNSILLFSPVTDYFPGRKRPGLLANFLNHGGLTPPPDEEGTFPTPASGN